MRNVTALTKLAGAREGTDAEINELPLLCLA